MSSPPPTGRQRRLTSDPGSCWASLPEDVLGVVASRLLAGDLLDYVRLRAVCRSWRSGTADPRGRGVADPRFHPRRWMMLPEGHYLYPGHPNLGGFVRFLNLDTGALVRARIPYLGVGNFWPIDSVDGLLLLLRDTVDDEGAVRLLHPFTGDFAEFPPIGTLASRLLSSCPPSLRNRRLTEDVCASVSVDAAGAISIMLPLFSGLIAFATSMDRQWTLSTSRYPLHYPRLSFQGKLYMVHTPQTSWGEEEIHHILQLGPPIMQDDGGRALPQPKLIATIPAGNLVCPDALVECNSEILVLGYNDQSASQITVFKLADLVQQRFIPVESIGGNTLFFDERSICVSSKVLSTVKGDNVVYRRPSSEPPRLAQYHLSSGSLSQAVDTCSLYSGKQGPSCLVLYIFSCCIPHQWSRGIIFRIDQPSFRA